jgi:L-ascorbate metabolism protein UlaG (beta-lactamase superfamily)
MAILPWGVADLTRSLGFDRVIELEWWETFSRGDLRITLTPSKHWGARVLRDHHRGYGGFLLECHGRRIYHAGDSAYFDGFKEIGKRCTPEIALLPIGAYHPESFRNVHMGPDDAVKVFRELQAKWFVPMHYGTFRLSFEEMDEPLTRLRGLVEQAGLTRHLRVLEEGVPEIF